MTIRRVGLVFAAAMQCQDAAALDCLVCDPEIVMTPQLAACFLQNVPTALIEMESNALSYHLVNLGGCEGVSGGPRGGDETGDSLRQIFAWEDIRNARADTATEPTPTFILDRAGILCLEAAIRANPAVFDPAAAFRPVEMCDP